MINMTELEKYFDGIDETPAKTSCGTKSFLRKLFETLRSRSRDQQRSVDGARTSD